MISPSLVKVWFTHACSQLDGIVQACLFIGEPDTGPYNLLTATDDGMAQVERVHQTVAAVLKRRKSVVIRTGSVRVADDDSRKIAANAERTVTDISSRNLLVTCPILVDRRLHGAVCIEFKHDPAGNSQDYVRSVESAINWLQLTASTGAAASDIAVHSVFGLQVAIRALSLDSASAAATAVVTELAARLSCERVSLGFKDGNDTHLYALSHSARYENKQNMIRRIEAAMDEAIAQTETLVYPADDVSPHMLQAQGELSRHYGTDYICTIPMIHEGEVLGAVCLERRAVSGAFVPETVELCEQLTSLFTPIIQYRRLLDRPVHVKAFELVRTAASSVFGRGHLGLKLASAAVIALLISVSLMHWEYRISANSVLEGTVERVITAPEEGFIKEAPARPGDLVEINARLAMLDDRELRLERLKWAGKQKQTAREYREALASHEKSQIGILRAKLDQAQAQIDILDKKLERTIISSPITGIIVSGDFTRALGSPVERGQILYKVSPLDQYRVLLKVDESDVAELSVGMKGELTLAAAAEDTFDITVKKITPVSVPGEGANYFQVEASMSETPEFLRPGMQGVSKIHVGERRLLWIWTHKMTDWLRLKLWTWL